MRSWKGRVSYNYNRLMAEKKKPTPRYNPTPRYRSASQRKPAGSAGKSSGERTLASTANGKETAPNASGNRRPAASGAGSRKAPASTTSGRRPAASASGSTKRASSAGGSGGRRNLPIILGAVGVVAVVALVVGVALPSLGSLGGEAKDAGPAAKVSFVAVGDNLPDDYIGWYADGLAGEMGDGQFDYKPLYEPIAPYIQEADLAYINEETHLGGDDIGPQGYPSFNATDAMATAVVETGWDFVASASNHSYDWGWDALTHSLSVWEKQPVAFTGTSVNEEQYNRIPVLERNGITFALLDYTYGVNYDLAQLPPYTINLIDEQRIASDVARAHEMADVVLVAMHWGTELLTEADEDQVRLAQLLADLDVDVVIGSHPHVIGPMAWVANSNNPDHRTLVAYSLGNFLADHEAPLADNVLEGMITCDFVRETPDSPVIVENVRWVPLVCHSSNERNNFAVYALDDYPAELAKTCRALSEVENPTQWLYDETKRIVGEQWFQ